MAVKVIEAGPGLQPEAVINEVKRAVDDANDELRRLNLEVFCTLFRISFLPSIEDS